MSKSDGRVKGSGWQEFGPSASGNVVGMFLMQDRLIGVAEFKVRSSAASVTLSVTRIGDQGSLDLVALLHQACPRSKRAAAEMLRAQWPSLVTAFEYLEGSMTLKDVQQAFSQDEITRHSLAHLRAAYSPGRAGEAIEDQSVVAETATMWKLLTQFGSFRPAEVLSEFTGAKPRTINARLKAARDKGLLPPVERRTGQILLRPDDVLEGR